ncbi:transcription factor FapR [Iocasia frigidifontis]|uniref:Transcription factor FapR n=1 Tax=Iocasia fonsfrigidae TaxID=2682810 RepID=A0A8A7K8T5_9FIRM|nr:MULTISPECIES: transcription factor FapR [Halanaerobiaceae]AZO95334.1 transcription factor FapR [Halocella sp. SP3-1]QTL98213.1 transcription factor FapR [Iocasia fonsfrigidae]
MKISKRERQKLLKKTLSANPLLTDRELSEKFGVSIQTVRLDRLELGIPEVRERTKSAASAYARLKSVNEGEVIGELISLELDKSAESHLITTKEMALQRSEIVRGHYLFAQANSLAVAVINAKAVLTGSVKLRFHNVVEIGNNIKARAVVKKKINNKYFIEVNIYNADEIVFSGEFIMFAQMEG